MEEVKKGKKTALYGRVSTDTQQSGLEAQLRTLKEFCERNNIQNYEIFADENQSGAKVSRPSLDRMMNAVKNGEIDKVVVYSFSRFARSTTHLLSALEEFKLYKVDFISLTEQIQTDSPMGRAFFTVIAAIAQLERELICERVKNGLRNARLKGKLIGRKKMRPSELIRALLKKKISYRKIADICSCSHGSISAEAAAVCKEEAELKRLEEEKKKQEQELIQSTVTFTESTTSTSSTYLPLEINPTSLSK